MARKLTLRTIKLNGANGADSVPFSYGAVMLGALRFADPQRGVVMEDVIRAVEIQTPIDEALTAGREHVVLSEDQYKYLLGKIEAYPFAFADPIIAEFGRMIRNAPEIGTE